MDRKLFIKNVFGALIGVAFLPKAITEFASVLIVDDILITDVIYLDLDRFMVGDLLKVSNKQMFLITKDLQVGDRVMIAKNVIMNEKPFFLELRHKEKVNSPKITRFASTFKS